MEPIHHIYQRSEDNRIERLIIITVFLVLHIFSHFVLMHYSLPLAIVQISSALLLIIAGWLFGVQGAVVIWLLVLFTTGALIEIYPERIIIGSTDIISMLIFVLVIGCLAGMVSELYQKFGEKSQQLKKEIMRRRDKDLLFRELNHRTKNNLALIAGMLDLQIFNSDDHMVREALTSCKTRILSIAELYTDLDQQDSRQPVNIKDYIDRLIAMVEKSFVVNERITIERDVDEISVDARKAVAYSLIINELLTNALKHAFNERDHGRIKVEFKVESKRTYLKVEDNGCGLPDKFENEMHSGNSTIGMVLIKGLVEQLDAAIETKNDKGACFIITGKTPA